MNVISSSYGNDSVALIQWAHEVLLKDVTVTYCNTGWSAPNWQVHRVQRGEDMALLYGFKSHTCRSKGMAAPPTLGYKGWRISTMDWGEYEPSRYKHERHFEIHYTGETYGPIFENREDQS